jgi:hypothetical protein
MLPLTVAGLELELTRDIPIVASGPAGGVIADFLAERGRALDDVSAARVDWQAEDGRYLVIGAVRIDGVPAVAAARIEVELRPAGYYEWQEMAGRWLLWHEPTTEPWRGQVQYPIGDVMYTVDTSDPALLQAALESLPEAGPGH